jgi:alpha-N-arabinofuranosidase
MLLPAGLRAQQAPTLTLDLTKADRPVSPTFYGLMTEEINHAFDGGLYAELIQNRIFKDDPKVPAHWSAIQDGGASCTISLDKTQPVNAALTTCLRLDVTTAGKRAGVANEGFWGIPVKPSTTYRASFYAKAAKSGGPLTVTIESKDGATTYAQGQVPDISGDWKQYSVTLTTGTDVTPTKEARFVISTAGTGPYWFNLVSLFPPTFNDRPNGNRVDIMNLLGDMKPRFLRMPGGNYLEGDTFHGRFAWDKTLGPLDQRAGHPGPWSYRSSDGFGLLEFLEWCEDLKMQPVLAVFAGYVLRQDYVDAGTPLQGFVDNALDEIQYVTGDASTKWGAVRAKDGHPKPFHVTYVEIGNEDWIDRSGSYEARFAQFYDAIREKYPNLKIIATAHVKSRTPDVIDDHYYRSPAEMEGDVAHYDNYSRTGPKIFVGEWATRVGAWNKVSGTPTPDMSDALSDAAWLTGLERNADLIVMQAYAPLFVNVSPGARQWEPNLIGYDALNSYGSPSYYAQKMFSNYIGNRVVPITAENIPLQTGTANLPALFQVATRDTKTGAIYLKVVNTGATAQTVQINLKGADHVMPMGLAVILAANSPADTNTITDPTHIEPVSAKMGGLSSSFSHTFAPYSVNVLEIDTR